jgi:hypothetical protein
MRSKTFEGKSDAKKQCNHSKEKNKGPATSLVAGQFFTYLLS